MAKRSDPSSSSSPQDFLDETSSFSSVIAASEAIRVRGNVSASTSSSGSDRVMRNPMRSARTRYVPGPGAESRNVPLSVVTLPEKLFPASSTSRTRAQGTGPPFVETRRPATA